MAIVKGLLGCGNSKQEVNLGIALNERIPELLRVNSLNITIQHFRMSETYLKVV